MSSSKTAVVGRRLRRTLSALLAAGFGVTWWGLVPPARADAAPKPGPCLAPQQPQHVFAKRVDVTHKPTRRLVTLAIAKRVPPRKFAQRVVPPKVVPVIDPITVAPPALDPTPVVMPVQEPVVDPVQTPVPIDDIYTLPPTRSS